MTLSEHSGQLYKVSAGITGIKYELEGPTLLLDDLVPTKRKERARHNVSDEDASTEKGLKKQQELLHGDE